VAIAMEQVAYAYGRRPVLRSVDLEVPQGAISALLGDNGAGKSTLLRLLAGIHAPTNGTITFRGTPIQALTVAQRQRISYVAEGQELPAWMRVHQLQAWCAPLYPTWDPALAKTLLDRFALDPAQKIGQLSRGQRMKVALLCALASRPELLLMDEPFTGMDVGVKDELVRGLLDVANHEGWTVLLATHDLGEIETLVDWVAFLRDGQIAMTGPLEQLRERFQRVAFTLRGDAPPRWPHGWQQVERSGARFEAIVDRSQGEVIPKEIAAYGTDLQLRPLSLKELYLFVAAHCPLSIEVAA
jgi:ABC-2 type transport system ATP-binding protein